MINDGQVTLVGFSCARKIARCETSLTNEIADVYFLMISLLLIDKYSAFQSLQSDDDDDDADSNTDCGSSQPPMRESQQTIRKHGKGLANYLTLQAA